MLRDCNWLDHMTADEDLSVIKMLAETVRQVQDRVSFVEVGTWSGYAAARLREYFDDYAVVDLFTGGYDRLRLLAMQAGGPRCVRAVFEENMRIMGYDVEILQGDSSSIGKDFPPKSKDIVFIDADHSFEGCNKDIAAWMEVVKPGGFLCGHDIIMKAVRHSVVYNLGRNFNEQNNVWWKRMP